MSLARIAFPANGETALQHNAGTWGLALRVWGEPRSALTVLVVQLHAAGPEKLEGQADVVHLLKPADGGHAELLREIPAACQKLHGPPSEQARGGRMKLLYGNTHKNELHLITTHVDPPN